MRRALPADCALCPISSGALLVSRSHATFCRIPATDLDPVKRVIAGAPLSELSGELREALGAHGFFGPPRPPKRGLPSAQLQLTNSCNLRCAYCCTGSGAPRPREIDRATWFGIVDRIRRAMGPGALVSLMGGEPLRVPWALDLAEHILDSGLALSVFTNGSSFTTDDVARRVAALLARGADVRVSLAGPTAASCDAASGGRRFDDVIAGVHRVARFGAIPAVDLMLYPGDVDETAREIGALRALLPPGTRVSLGVLFVGGREDGARVFGSRAELEGALDRIAFEAGEVVAAPRRSPLADRREGCSCALGQHLHVRSDGVLFTCFKMEEPISDLRDEPFEAAWERVRLRVRPASALRRCEACPLATLCGGGCRSENLRLTGDADEPACGPWRVRVLSELLAEDRITAVEWSAAQLLEEARARGIEAPSTLGARG